MIEEKAYRLNIAPNIQFDLKQYELEGLRFFISGMSGSGKSNTAKVICEELLAHNITLLILDSEGEYASLKEKYDSVLVIGGKFADIPINNLIIEDLIQTLYESGVSLIFDTSELIKDELITLSTKILEKTYYLGTKYRKPIFLIIEECNTLAPQTLRSPSLEISRILVTRGRKRGIHSIWLSQRTALVNKDIISQCNIRLFGKMIEKNDIAHIRDILRNASISESEIMNLIQEFFLITIDKKEKIKFRKARIRDLAKTPLFDEEITLVSRKNKNLEKMIMTLMEKAEKLATEEKEETNRLKILEKQANELKEEIEEKDEKINLLQHDLDLVSKLKVVTTDNKQPIPNLNEITLNIKQKEQQITALKTDYRIMKTKLDELTNENTELKNTIEKLGKELSEQARLLKYKEKIKRHISELSNLVEVTPNNSEYERIIDDQKKEIEHLKEQQGLDGNFYTKLGFIKHPMVEERLRLVRKDIQSTPLINTIMTIIIEKDRPVSYKELSELSNYPANQISAGATALAKFKIIRKIRGPNGMMIDIDLESIPTIIREEKRKHELREKAKNLFS